MRTYLLTPALIALVLGTISTGCSEEDEPDPGNQSPEPSSINFLVVNDTIKQAGDSLVVHLKLNRKAGIDGHISVRLSGDAVHGQDFSTRPEAVNGIITLALLKETQSAQFTVFRSDPLQAEKTINLILEDPTEGFNLGEQASSSVKLLKQPETEPAGTINFSDVFVHISEAEPDGFEIGLDLSGSITQTESVFIDIVSTDGFVYGTHFTTNPAAIQNEFDLEVTPGTETMSFKIYPVDDNLVLGTYEVVFRISATTGQLQKGTITELVVRVEEDDTELVTVSTIAELKNMFGQYEGEFFLVSDYFIEGIITSGSNVIDNKTAYIQDETGGIMLRFTIQNFLKLGDKVIINLKNASGNIINGQKAMSNVYDMLGIKLDENQVVVPEEIISPDQLETGNFEGRRVRINNVSFTDANGTNVFEGNRPVTDGTSGFIVTTYSTAPFRNVSLPEGNLSVVGIVGDWGYILPQVYNHDIIR